MKITVEFSSLDEFLGALRPQEYFLDDPRTCTPTACQPGRTVDVWKDEPTAFEKAQAEVRKLAQEAAAEPTEAAELVPFDETKKDPPKDEKPAAEPTAALTEDYRVEVRKTLSQLNKQTGRRAATEIIHAAGYDRLTEVPLEKLPAIMQAALEALHD